MEPNIGDVVSCMIGDIVWHRDVCERNHTTPPSTLVVTHALFEFMRRSISSVVGIDGDVTKFFDMSLRVVAGDELRYWVAYDGVKFGGSIE